MLSEYALCRKRERKNDKRRMTRPIGPRFRVDIPKPEPVKHTHVPPSVVHVPKRTSFIDKCKGFFRKVIGH
jgi:hypothetical protein